MTTSAVVATGLMKRFGDTYAVSDLSFEAERGAVTAILGPNGAGKTTTIRMLTTLLPIDGGTASVAGFDVATEPAGVRRSIGLAGQSAAIDEKLTARENLELFGRLYKIPSGVRKRRIDELIDEFDVADFADRTADTYSGGERRRLDLVACLIANPPVLFLDEPTTGLDPRARADLWAATEQLAAAGTCVVLTTQYLDEADRLADSIVIIDRGEVRAAGASEELKSSLERDVLELHVAADARMDDAASIARQVNSAASIDPSSRMIHIPVPDGARQSLDALRRLDEQSIEIEDFQLRRPTLDDVFLNMTTERVRT